MAQKMLQKIPPVASSTLHELRARKQTFSCSSPQKKTEEGEREGGRESARVPGFVAHALTTAARGRGRGRMDGPRVQLLCVSEGAGAGGSTS